VAWPNPRFTDNGDGTVTDELTGLLWLKDADCFGLRHWGSAVSAVRALEAGECGLTDSSMAGDWRLPSVKELQSLIAYGYHAPALANASGLGQWREGDPFSNVRWNTDQIHDCYWSSTYYVPDASGAWLVCFSDGSVRPDYKEPVPPYNSATSYHVWPVRGGEGGDPYVDKEPPVLTLPERITAEATGAAGAVVAYAATAIDKVDGAVPVTCGQAAGSTFPIGTTTVACSVTDKAGNTGTGSFPVTVADTTAPVLRVPDPLSVRATSHTGAVVTYAVAAADVVAPNPAVSCVPASGSTFPIGVTTVACTAADSAGNVATASFTVAVDPGDCSHRHRRRHDQGHHREHGRGAPRR